MDDANSKLTTKEEPVEVASDPPSPEKKPGWYLLLIPLATGILGMAGGFAAGNMAAADAGDSPTLGIGIMMLGLLSGLATSVATKIVIDLMHKKGNARSRMVVQGGVLVFFCFLVNSCWQDIRSVSTRRYDAQAVSELKNLRTSLEGGMMDFGSYSTAWRQMKYKAPEAVVLKPSRLEKDDYEFTGYHINGKKEFMIRLDAYEVFVREKKSTNELNPYTKY